MYQKSPDYLRGWNAAMDYMANFINSFDTEYHSSSRTKSEIYKATSKAPDVPEAT